MRASDNSSVNWVPPGVAKKLSIETEARDRSDRQRSAGERRRSMSPGSPAEQHVCGWVRQAAASADHPHVFSFAQTDSEAGAAAVARYEERQAQRAKEEAAEKERLEKARAAGEKRKAEVEDALAMLTADDEEAMPEKQRLAIENAAAGAGAPMSAHMSE